jgi:O-antigen/teichoic acid export membrane protein
VYRQIIGYIPSVVIPALISVLMIYAYTRLLTPAAFGTYTYVFSAILVLQTSLFFALPTAVMRFYPRAAVANRQDGFLKEAYVIFYALSAVIIVIGVCAGLIADLPDAYRHAAWLALPLLLFRSAVQLNQSVNRSANKMRRHNSIESLHAVLGFGLGLIAIYAWEPGSEAIVLGLLIAAVVCSLIDFKLLVSPLCPTAGKLDRKELTRLVDYAWPLVAAAGAMAETG